MKTPSVGFSPSGNKILQHCARGENLRTALLREGLIGSIFGSTYFVDPANGNDNNSGEWPTAAKKTLQAAVDLCVDWKGDVIFRARGTETVTTPVLFNKKGIAVIADALGHYEALGEYHTTYGSHTDDPAAIISEPCTLMGLGFCGSQAAGASLEIDCGGAGGSAGGRLLSVVVALSIGELPRHTPFWLRVELITRLKIVNLMACGQVILQLQ